MRLTLRTLIAYLDDILDPAQTKEIGLKISESEVAQQLVNRVKEVLRRRRLTAPAMKADNANIDANRIAEYLDNTLSPADVAEVEKICLESDVHLAEAAACHQILTLVLGEPVDIIPESREKMYSLGPKAITRDAFVEGEASATRIAPATRESTISSGQVALSANTNAKPVPESSLPRELTRKSFLKHAVPVVIVLLCVGTLVGLIITDGSLFPSAPSDEPDGTTIAKNNPPTNSVLGLGERNHEDSDVATGQKTAKTNEKIAASGKELPMPKLPDNFDPIPRQVIPEAVRATKPIIVNHPADLTNQNVAKTNTTIRKTNNIKKSRTPILPVVKQVAPVRFFYGDKMGVNKLWKFDKSQRDYVHVPPDSVLSEFAKLIVPESFGTEFSSEMGVVISVSGGASFTILPSDSHSLWGFDLKQGKLRIRRDSSIATNPDPAQTISMAILLDGKLFYLSLLTPDAECGIEVFPSLANGFEKSLGEDTFSGAIYSVVGKVKVTNFAGGEWLLASAGNRNDWLPLTPSVRKQFTKPGSAIPKLLNLPEWITNENTLSTSRNDNRRTGLKQKLTNTRIAALQTSDQARYFLNEFEVDRTLTENLLAIAHDRRAGTAALAVKSLALTNNYKELIEILVKAQHQEARLEAYLGLRRWLPLDKHHSELLHDGLKIYYSSKAVVPLVRLIWGIDRSNLKNPKDSEDFLEWLNDPEQIVRELTFHQLSELTDLRFGYRADSSFSQRSRSIGRWKNHLKRYGAIIVDKKKKKPAKKE